MTNCQNDLVARYKRNYSIPDDHEVTEAMVTRHWELESGLTRELLASTREARFGIFENAYSRLYSELDWLNVALQKFDNSAAFTRYAGEWLRVVGEAGSSLYEIGSGKGELIAYLAKSGIKCKGSEVTSQRGRMHVDPDIQNLSWGVSDGVNINVFEPFDAFDVVISDQVIEHLHPDDVALHFCSVRSVLRSGGRYVFNTPHFLTGPHDVSRVFGCKYASGMHLKEYSYRQLIQIADHAEFADFFHAGFYGKARSRFPGMRPSFAVWLSKRYMSAMVLLETFILRIPFEDLRFRIARLLRRFKIFNDNIFLVATTTKTGGGR